MDWEELKAVENSGFGASEVPDDAVSVSTKNNYIRVPRKLAEEFADIETVLLLRGEGIIGLALGVGKRRINWQNGAATISFPKNAHEDLDFEDTKRFSAELGREIYEGDSVTTLEIDLDAEL